MAKNKDLTARISTLKNMQKVMRAMNMIATVKLRKLFRLQASLVLFKRSLETIAINMEEALKYSRHPFVSGYKKIRKAHIVVFSADKGLCGPHNTEIYKALDTLANIKKTGGVSVEVSCIGVRGTHYAKRKGYKTFRETEIKDRVLNEGYIVSLSSDIFERFLAGDVQEVHVIYNRFISTIVQKTVSLTVYPLTLSLKETKNTSRGVSISAEPVAENFSVRAGGQFLYYKLMMALFNSYLSEESSRMIAMENGTKNAEELINRCMIMQNRARQASITDEIIEIVSGKEALEG